MISEREYHAFRDRIDRYEAARREFDPKRFERDGGYTPAEIGAIEKLAGCAHPTNNETSAVELYEFATRPPQKLFAYWREKDGRIAEIVNWMGEPLARHIERQGDVYRSPFGDRRRNVRFVAAHNGLTYSGTCYLDNGSYGRFRLVKG